VPVAFASLALLVGSSLALYAIIVRIHRRFFSWSL
jgi:NitT/TauT family transport system permease protein